MRQKYANDTEVCQCRLVPTLDFAERHNLFAQWSAIAMDYLR